MGAARPLTHREACYELRRSARLLAEEKLTLWTWFDSVERILGAREGDAQVAQAAPR